MEFAEHGTTVAPYVVKALRRYMLGPDAVGTIKVGVLVDETVAPQDTAPRPLELDPDSAAAARTADSLRTRGARSMRTPPSTVSCCSSSTALIAFGLLTLYSAGQTDVPTRAGGRVEPPVRLVRSRDRRRWVVFHMSLAAARVVGTGAVRLQHAAAGLVLVVGTGAGTAESSHSWLSHRRASDRPAVGAGQGGHRAHAGAVSLRAGRSHPARSGTSSAPA